MVFLKVTLCIDSDVFLGNVLILFSLWREYKFVFQQLLFVVQLFLFLLCIITS